jgi:hypothetical protein
MKTLNMVAMVLVWAGGLNWGLVGLFQFNLVDALVGGFGLTNIVYILVGLATVYSIYVYMMAGSKKK